MKLIYGTLGAMLAELRERKVEAVRVSRVIQSEVRRTPGRFRAHQGPRRLPSERQVCESKRGRL